jgi:hypothetical protein
MKLSSFLGIGCLALPIAAVAIFATSWMVSSHRNGAALEKAKAMCGVGPKVVIHDQAMWNKLLEVSRMPAKESQKFASANPLKIVNKGYKSLLPDDRIIIYNSDYYINDKLAYSDQDIKMYYKYPISFAWIIPGFADYSCFFSTPSELRKVSVGGGVKLKRNTADQLIERQRPALQRPRLG